MQADFKPVFIIYEKSENVFWESMHTNLSGTDAVGSGAESKIPLFLCPDQSRSDHMAAHREDGWILDCTQFVFVIFQNKVKDMQRDC